jgi:hypothetical protein
MKKLLLSTALLFAALVAQAQYSGPRLFLDVPSIYFAAPDVERIGNNLGAGAEIAMNVGTHWGVARLGGGAMFTVDPKADEVSVLTTPYLILEAGAGIYRSNGNKCAKTHAHAFTIIAKGGIFYNFNTQETEPGSEKPDGLDYTVGAEFGHFFIRDVFQNFEFFLDGRYHTKAEVVSANLGVKWFLNLRANR